MTAPSFKASEETLKILEVLKTLPLGGIMTYANLSYQVGFKVTSGNHHYRSAVDKALKYGVSICYHEHNVSFRRRTHLELAEQRHRFNRVARQGKRAAFETREALKSNDKSVQAKASISAAKAAMLSGMKATTNRDIPGDRI